MWVKKKERFHTLSKQSRTTLSETQVPRKRMQVRETAGLQFAIVVQIRIERWRHSEHGAGLEKQAV